MNIVIKIIDGEKIIDFSTLDEDKKKEYGQRLNEQGLSAMGYVRSKEAR
nr:MAG TPA: hypothetical protein [Caudoviricetes sp.]